MELRPESAGLASPGPRAGSGVVRQLIRYGGVGILAAGVDLSSFWLLTAPAEVEPLLANLISRTLGGFTCFFFNKIYTFGHRLRAAFAAQMSKFWMVFLVSLGLSELLLGIAIHGAGLPDLASKVFVEAVLFLFNFYLLRSWAFR